MLKQLLIRPSTVFLVVWLAAIYSHSVLPVGLKVEINYSVIFVLALLYLLFVLLEKITNHIVLNKVSAKENETISRSLNKIFRLVFYLWFPLYLVNILFSGGIPIYWQLSGDERSYGDFGIPSFTGMVACLRLVAVVVFVAKNKRNYFDWFALIIIVTSVISELSRGNAFLLFITMAFAILFLKPFKFRHFIYYLMGIFTSIIGFAGIGVLRYNNLYEDVLTFTAVQLDIDPSSNFLLFEMGLVMITRYLGTPINNIFYALNTGFEPLYYPLFSVMTIIPTFIRQQLFTEKVFPLPLYNEAYNTGSFLSIFFADFGVLLTLLLMIFFFYFISYSYTKARRGDHFHMLLIPLHLSAVGLSIFSNYFIILQYLFFPLFLKFFLKLYK